MNLQMKHSKLDHKLSNYYKLQFENESKRVKDDFVLKLKEMVLEKELRLQELTTDNNCLIVKMKEYENNYISRNDHNYKVNTMRNVNLS